MNLNEKIKLKTNRPPILAVSLLLCGFGIQHSASLFIKEEYIRSIVLSIAQSMIFLACTLKKNDSVENTTQADPFSSIIPEASTVINDVIENDAENSSPAMATIRANALQFAENQIVLASNPIQTPPVLSPDNVIND